MSDEDPNRTTDLWQGDFGCLAWLAGFVVGPLALAWGGYHLGTELLGWPILGWILAVTAFVIGLAIGKYVAFGALLGIVVAMMGGLAGFGIAWMGGLSMDETPLWGLGIGGGVGFVVGAIATVMADLVPAPADPNVNSGPEIPEEKVSGTD